MKKVSSQQMKRKERKEVKNLKRKCLKDMSMMTSKVCRTSGKGCHKRNYRSTHMFLISCPLSNGDNCIVRGERGPSEYAQRTEGCIDYKEPGEGDEETTKGGSQGKAEGLGIGELLFITTNTSTYHRDVQSSSTGQSLIRSHNHCITTDRFLSPFRHGTDSYPFTSCGQG